MKALGEFIRWMVERWRSFDKQTRRLMRIVLFFLIGLLFYGFVEFWLDKHIYNKPAEYLWLHNYVKPDTVVKYVEKPIYIRTQPVEAGRDFNSAQRDQTIDNRSE